MSYQTLIKTLSLSVAVLLFFIEAVPFFSGYENLPELIASFKSEEQVVEQKPATETSQNEKIVPPESTPTIEKPNIEELLPSPPFFEKKNTHSSSANLKNNTVTKANDCGEYWTEWTAINSNLNNPCPENCQKGQSLESEKRIQGFPPQPEIKHKFQCLKIN